MLLKEWEIWHTYSTYFTDSTLDLRKISKNLIQSKVLQSALLDNGEFYWLDHDRLVSSKANITPNINHSTGSIVVEKDFPEEYMGESLFQSARLRFSEMRIFSNEEYFMPHYLRGFLGVCRLNSQNGYNYLVYPVVKLYETGTLLVELRVRSPEVKVNTDEFIDKFVNLFGWKFNQVYIPPGLHLTYHHACFFDEDETVRNSLLGRLKFMSLSRKLQFFVDSTSFEEMNGDFNFALVPLLPDERNQNVSKDTNFEFTGREFSLANLAEMIFTAVGFAAVSKERGLRFLLTRPKNTSLNLGGFWSGRPHIHITRFDGQANKASENEKKFKSELGWIMARIRRKKPETGERYLPTNSRFFEDYGAYIASQGTLWVWSKQGLQQEKPWSDPNRGHLIYENQVKCEFLEYGYMLYRRLADVSGVLEKSEEILSLRQTLAHLEIKLSEAPVYGEIRDMVMKGWENMGVSQLKTLIAEMSSIRQTQASTLEQRAGLMWQIVLTLVFGLLLIPSIASDLIKPIWELSGLPRAINENLAALIDMVIALPAVFILILAFWKMLKK